MPGAGGIERELADGDSHASRTLVAEPENALAIADHDRADCVIAVVPEDLANSMLVGVTEKQSAGLAPDLAETLASFADRRRVHQRHHLFDVAHQHGVKQGFVRVLQVPQIGIALEIGFKIVQRLKTARRLIFKIANMWGKQSVQCEVGALVFSERGSLVQHGKVNQVEAGEPGLQNSLGCDAIFHVCSTRQRYPDCGQRYSWLRARGSNIPAPATDVAIPTVDVRPHRWYNQPQETVPAFASRWHANRITFAQRQREVSADQI